MFWKSTKPIKQVSANKAAQIRARNKTYEKLDSSWSGCCQGCGRWEEVIDHSHLLSQKDFPHLAAHPANIVPHCRACHEIWHNPVRRWKLLDYVENMIFIQSVAPREFERMLGQSELKVEKHYPEELPRFYEVRDSLIL